MSSMRMLAFLKSPRIRLLTCAESSSRFFLGMATAAALTTTAHLSRVPFNAITTFSSSSSSLAPNLNLNSTPKRKISSSSSSLCRVRCASLPQQSSSSSSSRRSVSIAILLFNCFSIIPNHAIAATSALDKYVKRKKLDPLEAYVPAVILTKSQIKDLVKTLEADQPQYAACRSLLRSGPAASLRVNLRAVAQYASEDGKGDAATSDVDECLRALEDLDSLFLRASRNDRGAKVESMKSKISIALVTLDRLLQTVPSAVLDKGQAIADAYLVADEEDARPNNLDPELRKLESLL